MTLLDFHTQERRLFQIRHMSKNPSPANEDMVSPDSPLHTLPTETHTNDFDLPIAVRKGTRECRNRPLYPLSHYVSLMSFSPSHRNFLVSLNTVSVPNTLYEALSKSEWRNAMREEMNALEKNKTREIVDQPKGKNLVGFKWVFTLKYKADGSLERYKARLVAILILTELIIRRHLLRLQK